MKAASILAEITRENSERILAEREKHSKDLLEDVFFPGMEKAAKNGQYIFRGRVTPDTDKDLITEILVNNGYSVKYHGYNITISWMVEYFKSFHANRG